METVFAFFAGIAFLVLIIAMHNWRRRRMQRAAERIQQVVYGRPAQAAYACPSCAAPLEPGAAFCPRCGMSLRTSAPPPLRQQRTTPFLVYVVFGLLGLVGLLVLMFFWSSPRVSRPPTFEHTSHRDR